MACPCPDTWFQLWVVNYTECTVIYCVGSYAISKELHLINIDTWPHDSPSTVHSISGSASHARIFGGSYRIHCQIRSILLI